MNDDADRQALIAGAVPPKGLTIAGIRVSKKLAVLVGAVAYFHFMGEALDFEDPRVLAALTYLLGQSGVDAVRGLRR